MPDPEDVKEALVQMDVLESQGAQNVRYLINNYPSGRVERRYVERYLRQIPSDTAHSCQQPVSKSLPAGERRTQ